MSAKTVRGFLRGFFLVKIETLVSFSVALVSVFCELASKPPAPARLLVSFVRSLVSVL